jgi:6,7-dimethyl-8-ribityllumazine synthase
MLKKLKSSSLKLSASRGHFAIVCAEYNPEFTEPLLQGAERELRAAGALARNIKAVRVPGSFEIPVVAKQLAQSGKFDVVLALGVVLQGKTLHAQHILEATAYHLQQIAVETGVPIVNQILSPGNLADARKRTWPGPYHRGIEGARTAIRMAAVMSQLSIKGQKS